LQNFCKKKYEEIIRQLYATTPTAELALLSFAPESFRSGGGRLSPQGETPKPAEIGSPPQGETSKPAEISSPPQGETSKPAEISSPPQGGTPKPAEIGSPPQGETSKPAEISSPPQGKHQNQLKSNI